MIQWPLARVAGLSTGCIVSSYNGQINVSGIDLRESMELHALAERIMDAYRSLDLDHIESLRSLYSDTIVFEDPAHRIEGIESVIGYFKAMYANVNSCTFDFESVIVEKNHIVLTWTMHLSHPRLRRGQMIEVAGSSVLEVAGDRIARHRDYFDLGAMAYEHIPLLGRVVASVKHRLGQ